MATEPTGTPGTPAETTPRRRSWGDAYLWMLILSLVFLTIGCAMLLLEWSKYDFIVKPSGF